MLRESFLSVQSVSV